MYRVSDPGFVSRLLTKLPRHTVIVPLVVTLIMSSCFITGWAIVRYDERIMIHEETEHEARHFAFVLESYIATRLALAEQLRNEWLLHPINSEAEFLKMMESSHELFGDFQAINWVNPDGIVEWISPIEENEPARGLDIMSLPVPSQVLLKAKETGKVQLTPPIRLAQGDDGFVAYLPIDRDGSQYGFLNVVFCTEPLIKAAAEEDLFNNFKLTIRDGDRIIYNSLLSGESGGPVFKTTIQVGDRTWEILAMKAENYMSVRSSAFGEMILIIGILISLVVGYLLRIAMVHQQMLQANDKVFRTFIENSPSAILLKDAKGRYTYANSLWHQWFNPKGDPIIGKTVHDLFPPSHADAIDAEEARVLKQGEAIEVEIQSPLANGKYIPTLLQKFPIYDSKGEIIAIAGVNTDLSVRNATEAKLRAALAKAEEANKSKSKFLATMSHELRTPLNAIIGFSDILHGQYFGPVGKEKYIEYARDIHESGQHLLSLIDNVLDISAIELGKRELSMESLSLDELLAECIKSVQPRAHSAHINLIQATPSKLPLVQGDDTAMKQIFLNLLTNAIKFSYPGDKVLVYAEASDDTVSIVIKDTGSGISTAVMEKITEPFIKGHKDSDITHEGVGLGLSIVKSLVSAHNGKLDIESQIGVGTKVTVSFPKLQKQLAA